MFPAFSPAAARIHALVLTIARSDCSHKAAACHAATQQMDLDFDAPAEVELVDEGIVRDLFNASAVRTRSRSQAREHPSASAV
jgi:hypothetical protein